MARNVDSMKEVLKDQDWRQRDKFFLLLFFFFFATFELNEKDFYNQYKNTKIGMCQNPDDSSWTIDNRR